MTDHPNPFALRQQVLFVSRTDPADRWRPGTIATAGAVDHMRRKAAPADYREWVGEQHSHDPWCQFVYTTVPPGDEEDESGAAPTEEVCDCRFLIVDADASGRWRDAPLITDRRRFQLLWIDTDGRLDIDSANTPLEETDIVHLSQGEASVEVDMHHLLKWAATSGPEA